LSEIKQGAINTLTLGCHLFGFGHGFEKEGALAVVRDQHHLSFEEDPKDNNLPEIEDVQESDEQTLIANKIRVSNIKGSHSSLLSPNKFKKFQTGTRVVSRQNKSP